MKYFSILLLLISVHMNIIAQQLSENSVPESIKSNFNTMFNHTPAKKWELTNGNYQATYLINGMESSAIFAPDGLFICFENAITANEVPELTRKYIVDNLSGKKIGRLSKNKNITGEVTYHIQAGEQTYLFDTNGNFLRIKADENNQSK